MFYWLWKWLIPQVKPTIDASREVTSNPSNVSYSELPPTCGMMLIQQLEGYRDAAYPDVAGIWTIGYGHTKDVKKGDVCTKQQALEWLSQDVSWAWISIQRLVKKPLTQNQLGSLLSFVYNIGSDAFSNSGVLRAINYGSPCDVPMQMKKWNEITIDGKRFVSQGLINRRAKEAQLWIGADWRQV